MSVVEQEMIRSYAATRKRLLNPVITRRTAHAYGITRPKHASVLTIRPPDAPTKVYEILKTFPKVSDIMAEVCKYYGITKAQIISSARTKQLVGPRHVAMYLARTMTVYSLPHIGRMMGRRDHTTILHGVRKIEAALPGSPQLAAEIAAIEGIIRERFAVQQKETVAAADILSDQVREVFLAELTPANGA